MPEKSTRFKIFFSELRRRKVTRLATIYAVTGLGFIEALDIIGGRFLIPEGTIEFLIVLILIGFPITMILGWIYDVTPKGIQKTEGLTSQEKASITSVTWKPSWVSVILFFFLVSISFAFFVVPRPNAVGFKEQDWIFIADLENNTDEEVFDHSLLHALTVTIDQSKRINIFPRNRAFEVLKRMKKEGVEHIDLPLALEIAERENIKVVLHLSISEISVTYLLIADLLDPYTGEIIRSRQVTAAGKENILYALDDLANIIRKDLGESLKKLHLNTVPLLQATTFSLEALRSLTRGVEAGTGQSDKAYEFFQKAISIDPEFAMAHAELGSLYYRHNNRTKGEEHFTIALSLLNRLTDRERLWIKAMVAEFRGNRDKAATRWGLFLTEFPNSYPGWYRMGYNYMIMGELEKSISAFTKAADIYEQKDPGALVNIASCYSQLQKYQKAIDFYLEAFEVDPSLLTHFNINNEFGFTYVSMGEVGEARKVFEKMIEGNDDEKAKGYRSLALLSMYSGQFSVAISLIHESILHYRTNNSSLSELRNRLYLAKMLQYKGVLNEFSMELNQINKQIYSVATEPTWYLVLGKMFVRKGELLETEKLVNEIQTRSNEGNKWDEAAYKILKGELELARGNLSEAVELLETASKLRMDAFALESLANCYHVAGDLDKAISTYEIMTGLSGSVGWEAQECWTRAHFSLGQLHEENGNPEEAIGWYERFLELWKDAEEDLPDLIAAKSRLEKLQAVHLQVSD